MENNLSFQHSLPSPPSPGAVPLTAEQMEKVLLDRIAAAKGDPTQAMWDLARFYKEAGQTDKAMDHLRRLLERTDNVDVKAQIILGLGQTAEARRDFVLAVEFYRHALVHEPLDKRCWYFIHNNLGYSLNKLGAFAEAERYCLTAIQINPARPNAFKNLGLALQGQGRYRDAAQCFVKGTQTNAADPRSLGHLEALLKEHPELRLEFTDDLTCCRKAVVVASVDEAKLRALWE